jgi:hypothetical protein
VFANEEGVGGCSHFLSPHSVNSPQEEGAGGQPHALGWAVHREGQAGLLLRLYLAAPVAVKASRARRDCVLSCRMSGDLVMWACCCGAGCTLHEPGGMCRTTGAHDKHRQLSSEVIKVSRSHNVEAV